MILSDIVKILITATTSHTTAGLAATIGTSTRTLYTTASGLRSIADPTTPFTPDTVVWIASMTKAITSVAALQQVEAGRLTLDGPIADILPDLATPQVLEGFSPAGTPILRPARTPITLRHLLTHTSGFSYNTWNADILRYMQQEGVPAVATCRRAALALPLIAEPGTAWNYGIGIDWAGLAVEAVTGRTLAQVIEQDITAPLGMADTGFRLTPGMRARLAAMHVRTAEGALKPIPFEIPQDPEFHMGGGGLYSTAVDYLRFCRMILAGGTLDGARILSPETTASLSRPQTGALKVTPLRTVLPNASRDAEFFPGQPKSWSHAFMLNDEAQPGGRSANSMAWAGLGNTYFWIDPARDLAGVLVTQNLPFADPAILAVFAAFEQAAYAT